MVQDLDASAEAVPEVSGMLSCKVSSDCGHRNSQNKREFHMWPVASLVVLTIALTMGAPAKITDMITGTYAGDGIYEGE